LSAEVGIGSATRPDKLLKVVNFLSSNVLKCQDAQIKNREFARLKITEALVPVVAARDSPEIFESMVNILSQG